VKRTLLFSVDRPRADWSEAKLAAVVYGEKGAACLSLPRAWVPPFVLIPAKLVAGASVKRPLSSLLYKKDLARIRKLAGEDDAIIVRSSVVGESIWERGTYRSVQLAATADDFVKSFDDAAREVVASAAGRAIGLMVQRYIAPASRGEFGNLQRISKTRDHWEISNVDRAGVMAHIRLNSQRDTAADPALPIMVRSGFSQERLFGTIAAWLNNELLRGKSQRLSCEWLTDNKQFYLVQIDEEDEDVWGINPYQLRVPACSRPNANSGAYLMLAEGPALDAWDKLKVLDELWEEASTHKPVLFYVRLSDLPDRNDVNGVARLEADFRDLIGPSGIIVRTSIAAATAKIPNLPRTECLTPDRATSWCLEQAASLSAAHDLSTIAFVAHRFVASRASAWARADPNNPIVEIHALWGLPDALQYCPYDIWEVHVPTNVATDYPDYKSDMLISRSDGGWEHARVKNETARSNSIMTIEARDVAARSLAIAERLGRPCHIMWFIGCADPDETTFNLPWYWTETHAAERNIDRAAYRVVTVTDDASLAEFIAWNGLRHRQALSLKPTDLDLMRDTGFINRVGEAAKAAEVPVILSGSTLAHAYYQLRMLGCAVVTPSEKERSRIRRTANLGKLVRDKIPARIAERQELEVTRQIPAGLIKGFLLSKLLEEALEVRSANGPEKKREELADLFEVFRAMAKVEGLALNDIEAEADRKREKAGGFEQGLILLQTGIKAFDRSSAADIDRTVGQVLGEQTSNDTLELPFSFFGFMELDQPRSILFEDFGIRVEISLRPDRIEFRLVRSSEQLGLSFHSPLPSDSDAA
jgi:predicted house-cleaning noncanonical NTP pyrophosphatase (MazG superfamily)